MFRSSLHGVGLGFLIILAGCGGKELMPTPNIYVDTEFNPFADVPAELQGTTVDVMYVTDRNPVVDDDGNLGYGYGRSYSMAYGSAIVQFGSHVLSLARW